MVGAKATLRLELLPEPECLVWTRSGGLFARFCMLDLLLTCSDVLPSGFLSCYVRLLGFSVPLDLQMSGLHRKHQRTVV